MTSTTDNLCELPHVGPETAGKLREHGYGSFADIANASIKALHSKCDVGLSNAPEMINDAMNRLSCECPKCGSSNIRPKWGSYPENISPEQRKNEDVFCASCRWLGKFDALDDSSSAANEAKVATL